MVVCSMALRTAKIVTFGPKKKETLYINSSVWGFERVVSGLTKYSMLLWCARSLCSINVLLQRERKPCPIIRNENRREHLDQNVILHSTNARVRTDSDQGPMESDLGHYDPESVSNLTQGQTDPEVGQPLWPGNRVSGVLLECIKPLLISQLH